TRIDRRPITIHLPSTTASSRPSSIGISMARAMQCISICAPSSGISWSRRRQANRGRIAGRNGGGGGVELLGGKAGGRFVAGHECRPFARRNHLFDIVENPAAALVHDVEQAERPGAAI